jgi:hypothetical protein
MALPLGQLILDSGLRVSSIARRAGVPPRKLYDGVPLTSQEAERIREQINVAKAAGQTTAPSRDA